MHWIDEENLQIKARGTPTGQAHRPAPTAFITEIKNKMTECLNLHTFIPSYLQCSDTFLIHPAQRYLHACPQTPQPALFTAPFPNAKHHATISSFSIPIFLAKPAKSWYFERQYTDPDRHLKRALRCRSTPPNSFPRTANDPAGSCPPNKLAKERLQLRKHSKLIPFDKTISASGHSYAVLPASKTATRESVAMC